MPSPLLLTILLLPASLIAESQTLNLAEIESEVTQILETERVPAIKLRRLEKLQEEAGDTFSWGLHNALRHEYLTTGNQRRMYEQIEIILKNQLLDGYTIAVLSGHHLKSDPRRAGKALESAGRAAGRDNPHTSAESWRKLSESRGTFTVPPDTSSSVSPACFSCTVNPRNLQLCKQS